jgi:hypothetical protein
MGGEFVGIREGVGGRIKVTKQEGGVVRMYLFF